MSLWGRIKSSLRMQRPEQKQFVKADPTLDFLKSALTDNLNFVSLRAMLRSALSGDTAQGLQLFDEMVGKDANLSSVVSTREKAVTGLPWEIVSAADLQDVSDRKLADEAAAYVGGVLESFDRFDETLEHIDTGIAANLSVTELVWQDLNLIDMVCVPGSRLRQEPNEPGVIRVITSNDRRGIKAIGPKWIVHTPNAKSGYPLAHSLLYAQAFIYLTKMIAVADWVVFCEIFGMPIRIAKYDTMATKKEKEQLIAMMTNLGSKAFGVFSKAVELEFVESSQRGQAPFKNLIEWCDRTQAKLFLGGNLVSDTTGGTGTHAAASTQDLVRGDLRDDDLKREARTLRRQLISPLVEFQFPSRIVPVPHFQRVKPEIFDRVQEATLFRSAQEIGLDIGKDYAYDRLGIQKPDKDEEILQPSFDALGAGLEEGDATEGEGFR